MDPATLTAQLETAVAHQREQRLPEAEAIYRKILAQHPHNADALHLLGMLEAMRGRPEVGLPMLQQAVALLPRFVEAHRNHGAVLAMLGRQDEAIAAFGRAVQANPSDMAARVDLATAFAAQGRLADALPHLHRVLELAPNDAVNIANYGYVLARVGRHDEALRFLHRAVAIDPNCAPAHMQLSEAYWRAERYVESLAPAKRAVEILPNHAHAHLIYGNTLQVAGELEDACREYRRVIELNPDSFDAHNNLALTTLKMGDAREARRLYAQIRARWPGEHDALANESLAMLTLGDFEAGLPTYEARTTLFSMEAHRRSGKLWDGGDVRGKTVLLSSEQGFGDTIQFVRYAPLVAARGAKVLVGSPPSLVSVVSTVAGIERVIPVGGPAPQFDFITPLASLPRLFHTRLDAIPADVPYMSADPARVEQWRKRFVDDAKVKVGIVWAGTAAHQNDRVRSARLADFAPLAGVANVSFYSLQKGAPAAELSSPPAGMTITPLGDDLRDFGDTAALLMNLDLLISVDTSVVHLAGALSRPVWTLIARGPDWRWMLDREDTPWYPTMRLFRQQQLKNWRPVLERVAVELEKLVAAKKS